MDETLVGYLFNDQAAWMRDYVPAMEKMAANGYENLVDAPDFTTGVKIVQTNQLKRIAYRRQEAVLTVKFFSSHCYEGALSGVQRSHSSYSFT